METAQWRHSHTASVFMPGLNALAVGVDAQGRMLRPWPWQQQQWAHGIGGDGGEGLHGIHRPGAACLDPRGCMLYDTCIPAVHPLHNHVWNGFMNLKPSKAWQGYRYQGRIQIQIHYRY